MQKRYQGRFTKTCVCVSECGSAFVQGLWLQRGSDFVIQQSHAWITPLHTDNWACRLQSQTPCVALKWAHIGFFFWVTVRCQPPHPTSQGGAPRHSTPGHTKHITGFQTLPVCSAAHVACGFETDILNQISQTLLYRHRFTNTFCLKGLYILCGCNTLHPRIGWGKKKSEQEWERGKERERMHLLVLVSRLGVTYSKHRL